VELWAIKCDFRRNRGSVSDNPPATRPSCCAGGNWRKGIAQAAVRLSVAVGSELFTDVLPSYNDLVGNYSHEIFDHLAAYVDWNAHTDNPENFLGLSERALKGTHVSVEPSHLFRYLDEQPFRYNNRQANGAESLIQQFAKLDDE
jgi:ISXO2-like transposase domain